MSGLYCTQGGGTGLYCTQGGGTGLYIPEVVFWVLYVSLGIPPGMYSWVYLTPVHCRSPYYTPGVLAEVYSDGLLGSDSPLRAG